MQPAAASFSRKTRRSTKKGFHDDEDFSPPPNTEKQPDDDSQKKNKVYIPEFPLVFKEDSMLIFEVSEQFKKLPRLTVPTYFLSFASAVAMMDAFTTMSYFKGLFFTVPFLTCLGLSTYMNQQASVIISRIELLKEKS